MKKNLANISRQKQGSSIPAAKARKAFPTLPYVNGRDQYVTISRRELVGTISNGSSVSGFMVTPTSLNVPGYDASITCGTLFPWGAQVGFSFEKFRFQKLKVTLISGQSTAVSGRVYLAFDPDWADTVPTNKTQMMGLGYAVDSDVWSPVSLEIPARILNQSMEWRFCSPTSRTQELEPRTAFAGFFVVGIDTPSANLVWDMWVEYTVDLQTPTVENTGPVASATEIIPNFQASVSTPGTFLGSPSYIKVDAPLDIVSAAAAGIPSRFDGMDVNSVIRLPSSGPNTGKIDFQYLLAKSGTTPIDLINTYLPFTFSSVFDSQGVLLGLTNALGGMSKSVTGPVEPADMSIASKQVTVQQSLSMSDIKSAWPTAAYLVPVVRVALAAGLTFLRSSVKVEL